jgi:hypothetical protein
MELARLLEHGADPTADVIPLIEPSKLQIWTQVMLSPSDK